MPSFATMSLPRLCACASLSSSLCTKRSASSRWVGVPGAGGGGRGGRGGRGGGGGGGGGGGVNGVWVGSRASPAAPLSTLAAPPRLPQELAKFEIDSRNIVINQVIFPEEGEPAGCARAGGTPPLMALCQLRCPSVVPASGSCVPCFLCTCFAVLHFRGAAGMVGTDWTGQVAAPPAQPHSSRAGPRCSGQQPAAGGARAHAAEVPGPVLRPLRGLPPRAPAAAGRGGGEGGAVGLRRGGRCRAAAGLGW
jgi:hypothetical protein